MYNKELKTRFIRSYTNSISRAATCESLFNMLEPYEQDWMADICTMPAVMLESVIEECGALRQYKKWEKIGILRKYARWCIDEGVSGACDALLNIKIKGTEKMKTQTVSCPAQLQKYLNVLCDAEDKQSLDNVYRCFCWLAYMGFNEEDLPNLTSDNIDFKYMVIRYDNEEYPLYRESIPAFINCCELDQFRYYHPFQGEGVVVYKQRKRGNEILRGLDDRPEELRIDSPVVLQRLRTGFNEHKRKIKDKTPLNMTYFSIGLSGLFHRLHEMEIAGDPVDFGIVVKKIRGKEEAEILNGKFHKKVNGKLLRSAQLVKEYRSDYEIWKIVHLLS